MTIIIKIHTLQHWHLTVELDFF